MNKVLEYIIRAKDATAQGIQSALARIRETGRVARDTLDLEEQSYRRMNKEALKTYETLEQLNRRIDAPKKLAQEAKKAQDEANAALERYCQLCDEARRKEQARIDSMRTPKSQWNQGPLAGILAKGQQDAQGGNLSKAGEAFTQLAASAKRALPGITAVSASLAVTDGQIGKVARSIAGIASMSMAFGPLGAAIATVQLGFSMWAESMIEKSQKMLDATREWAQKTRQHLSDIKERCFADFEKGVEGVVKSVDRATERFERLAEARRKLTEAFNAKLDAQGAAEMVAMQRDMLADVADADDDNKRRVEAAWRLQIAEKEAELVEKSARRRAESERQALKDAEQRLALAEKNAQRLSEAAEEAAREKTRIEQARKNGGEGAISMQDVERYASLAEEASKRAEDEWVKYETLKTELELAQRNLETADIERSNAIARAQNAAASAGADYNKAELEYSKALEKQQAEAERQRQAEIEEEFRQRVAMEKAIASERMREMEREFSYRKSLESEAQARLSEAQSRERQAWGWYRNKDSWKAQLEEERAEVEAQKQFEKDLAKLKFRRNWRTAELSDDDELIRRVALAREERDAAAEYVRQTAEASERAASELEAIRAMLEEGGE